MSKTSRYLQAVGGMSLAFLIGLGAMAAQDAATAPKAAPQAQAQPQTAAASAPAKPQTFAPGMPGWMMHLPAEQQETARKIWLKRLVEKGWDERRFRAEMRKFDEYRTHQERRARAERKP